MKQSEAQNKATRVLYDPEAQKGTLKSIGGSQSDDWNDILANQTVQALWLKRSDPSTRYEQYSATVAALAGIGPKDELEGSFAGYSFQRRHLLTLKPHGAWIGMFIHALVPAQRDRYGGHFGGPVAVKQAHRGRDEGSRSDAGRAAR